MVFNDTRVIPARLWGRKETGGQVEILVERITGTHRALAHVRASKSPKVGSRLLLSAEPGGAATGHVLEVIAREDSLFLLSSEGGAISLSGTGGDTGRASDGVRIHDGGTGGYKHGNSGNSGNSLTKEQGKSTRQG